MHFLVLSFSHKNLALSALAQLQIAEEILTDALERVQKALNISEIFCLNTCNRVAFFVILPPKQSAFFLENTSDFSVNYQNNTHNSWLAKFFNNVYPHLNFKEFEEKLEFFIDNAALMHTLRVASSLESLVIGEREILTQLRTSFEIAQQKKLVGPYLRIIVRETLTAAKQIFNDTPLAHKEVSVSSVAYKIAQSEAIFESSKRIVAIGAGTMNQKMLRFFTQKRDKEIIIYNRTLEKAQKLARRVQAHALALESLYGMPQTPDILLICTGATWLTKERYQEIFAAAPKMIIDLGMPADVAPEIIENYTGVYIGMEQIQAQVQKNLSFRIAALPIVEEKLQQFLPLLEEKLMERKKLQNFENLPHLLRKTREKVWQDFKNDALSSLDTLSLTAIERMLGDLEQRQLNVVMQMARENNPSF